MLPFVLPVVYVLAYSTVSKLCMFNEHFLPLALNAFTGVEVSIRHFGGYSH